MSFIVECPFCGQKITADDLLEGEVSNCPGCGNEVYFSREDSVEDLDPVVERMRREHDASRREHAAELRQFAMLQQQKADSEAHAKSVVNVLLWIFIWGPLCAIGGYLVFLCLFRAATGRW